MMQSVDVKEEGDVLRSFVSRQLYNVGHEMLWGADVQQTDVTERICNSDTCDQIHRNSTSQETHPAKKLHECDVCHKMFKFSYRLTMHKLATVRLLTMP